MDVPLNLRCLASVRTTKRDHEGRKRSVFSTQAKFSPDGSTLISQTSDHEIQSYVLPQDLADETKQPHDLIQQSVFHSPSPIRTISIYPRFDIQDYSTTVYLSSTKDLPISLKNAFYGGAIHAQYPWQHPTTEAFIAPSSLCWSTDGSRFLAGSNSQISIFDAHRYGEGPISKRYTMERLGNSGHLQGYKGVVMGLNISHDGILAAGTTAREIGLYANEGDGEMITAFSVTGLEPAEWDSTKGAGIMQVAWSPCGTYLFAAERQSDGIHVYDVRNTLQRVAFLTDRNARTSQRLGIDVVPSAEGYEVWAGGIDGTVRMWKNPGSEAGGRAPDAEVKLHSDSVGSAVWHPQGDVLATCSGRREDRLIASAADSSDDEEDPRLPPDNSMKLWTI